MSLSTFKKKSATLYGTNISGKGSQGFSLNGNMRNNSDLGKSSLMYNSGTPMRGPYPIGYGGIQNRYPIHIKYNVYPDSALGANSIIPYRSVLTTRGMLHTRYKCIYNGTYPGNVVKNVYNGNITDNASQSTYIEKLSSDNTNLNPEPQGVVTDSETYIKYIKRNCILSDTHIPKPIFISCV
jgi:hypothetical protein